MKHSFDFVVIGAGSAGLTAAFKVQKAGLKTAVIDHGPVGGLCSLNGCNPKKVLVRSAEVFDEVRKASQFGIDIDKIQIDWSRVIDRKESFTEGVSQSTESQLKKFGIDRFHGNPRFLSRNTIEVNESRLEARGILIATGSMPRPLQFPGKEFVKTSDDILSLRRIPEDLVIIGAGVVAFEFGHVFARLGSRVTMLTPGKEALQEYDSEAVQKLVRFSEKLGIRLYFEAKVNEVKPHGKNFILEYGKDEKINQVKADFILNAAGRIPSIETLSLDKADVKVNKKGVEVNDFLRSPSNPHVFAAGDAHGRFQLSPIASYEGGVVARNFLEDDVEQIDYTAVPRVVFTIPPLASVGMTEKEAKQSGGDISVRKEDVSEWTVYKIHGESAGFVKIISDMKSGKILGAHLLGAAAGEEIHLFAMAIKFGLSLHDLKKIIFAYPVLASALPYLY